ncbi:hypothetical protein [Burkholderia contaminans]|uniref:hypothetical protein n=1 Tax=Burkholderia contaminans TaxID=488447 RepID=UPI001589D75F|nr:hypothetical protein [Burkholderia contaminans]
METAKIFLKQVLGDDVVPVKSIEQDAEEAGIASRTLRRASESLRVIKRRGDDGKSCWSLPKQGTCPTWPSVYSWPSWTTWPT